MSALQAMSDSTHNRTNPDVQNILNEHVYNKRCGFTSLARFSCFYFYFSCFIRHALGHALFGM